MQLKERRRKEPEPQTVPQALLMVMKLIMRNTGVVLFVFTSWYLIQFFIIICSSDLYKLTDEVLGQGAYAKVQGCISLQNGQEFAVKVNKNNKLF